MTTELPHFLLVVALIAIACYIYLIISLMRLRREHESLKRQFDEQVGRLLHETSEERHHREVKEASLRNTSTAEKAATLRNITVSAPKRISNETGSYASSDDYSGSEEDTCFEKGASPGGGCVGK